MDAGQAFQELKKFKLAKPESYLLCFVATAVAHGATRMSVQMDSSGCTVEFDGSPLAGPADAMFQAALESNTIDRDLAVGLYMAVQGDQTASYEGWGGSNGSRIKIEGGKPKFENLSKSPFKDSSSYHRVKVTAKKGGFSLGGLFGGGAKKTSEVQPEIQILTDRARFAPLRLEVNGSVVSKSIQLGRSLVCLVIQSKEEYPELQLSLGKQDTLEQLTVAVDKPISGILATGGDPVRDMATLSGLVRGVLYAVDAPTLASLGLRGVIASHNLELSADRSGIADESEVAELLEFLELNSLRLAEMLAKQLPDMNSIDRVEATDQLAQLCERLETAGKIDEVKSLYERLLEAQEDLLGDDDAELAPTLLKLASLRELQEDWDECIKAYLRVLEIYEVSKPDPALIATAQYGLAQIFLASEQYDKAEEHGKKALELRKKHLRGEDPNLGQAYEALARIYQARYKYPQRKFTEIDGFFQNAIRILEKNIGSDQAEVATLIFALAEHRRESRKYRDAEPLYRRAHKIRSQVFGAQSEQVATTLEGLGSLYEEQGKSSLAGQQYSEALQIWEQLLGSDHPEVAERLNNLVVLYRLYGRFAEAEPLYERMVGIHEAQEDQQDLVVDLTNLSLVYLAQAKFEEAEPLLTRALAILQTSFGQEAEEAWLLNHMGDLLDYQGRFSEAEAILLRSLGIWESLLSDEHVDITVTLDALVRHHRLNNAFEVALEYAEKSLAIKEKSLGELHPETLTSLGTLAELKRLNQEEEESLKLHNNLFMRRQKALAAEDAPSRLDNQSHSSRYSVTKLEAERYVQEAAKPAKIFSRYSEAEHLYLKAIFAREQALGPNHPDICFALDLLAGLYKTHRKFEGAETLYLRTLRLRKQALGPNHPDVCLSLSQLMEVFLVQKRHVQAEPVAQELLQIVNTTLGEGHPEAGRIWEKLAEIYGASGSHERQEECTRKAMELRQLALGTEHPEFAISLADVLVLQQKYDEASKLYGFVVSCLEDSLGNDHPDLIPIYEKYAQVLRKQNKEMYAVELETQVMVLRALHGLDFGDD